MTDGQQSNSSDGKKFHASAPLDAELQNELDAALGDMSLEDLMDATEPASEAAAQAAAPSATGLRRGTVISIQGDDIFVDMGGKSQGYLPASQFEDEPLPEVGGVVEVTVEGYDRHDGLLLLSRKGAVLAATWETLAEGQTVEGRVTGHNKGGLEMTFNGIRAFMPISQIELFRVEELDGYVNQKLQCQVMEVDHRDENVIVSRRSLLEIEAESKREELWETLAEGQSIQGTVRSIMPYGAFIDIGGVDGLLHVSDMAHTRVDKPEDVVSVGEAVEVKILKIDRESHKLSLGLKQALPDPWTGAEDKWRPDEVITGRITRLADFGAFIELAPGVEGLIPISEMSFERIHHPKQVLSEGETVKVCVMSVDSAARRMSLSLKRAQDDPWIGASVRWAEDSIVEGRVSRVADFGAFVQLSPGVEGLIHISELGDGFVRAVGDVVREGDAVKAKVLEVDEAARRISLSMKQLSETSQTSDNSSWADSAQAPADPARKRKKPLKGGLD